MRQRLASGATQPDPVPSTLSAARAADAGALRDASAPSAPIQACVAGTRALLVDPLSGKWRENLSEPETLAARLGPSLANALLAGAPEVRDAPSRGLVPFDIAGDAARLRHMPVVTDLVLSLGVFNARSDGRHRARFHVQMSLWNPSAMPLLTPSDKRLFLAEVEGAPELTVTNLDTGASFTTWLDRCPPGVFWSYTQGPRERGLWWWVEVLDITRLGMLRSGILPGEVYSLLMPDPQSQPYGFSRVIGRETWRYDDAVHPPGWVRPSAETFLPTDRIVIAARFITPGLTLRLHPYVGALDAGTEASAYPSPSLLTLAHLPWPDARVELSGAEYSRVDSNGYVMGERRFCWRARLSAGTEAEVFALAADASALGPCVDLADPRCRSRWEVTLDASAEARLPPDDFPRDSTGAFRDAWVNRHEALSDGAFSDWRLRDVPVDPPLDVASLRLLDGMPAADWLGELDRSFFSCPDASSPLPQSENPRLVPWARAEGEEAQLAQAKALRGSAAAELLALEGPFNVNHPDPSAWEAFLSSDPLRWSADPGGPSPAGRITAPAGFFSQPTGAMLAKYADAGPCDLADDALARLAPDLRLRAAHRQSVRSLPATTLRRLCECLASEIALREHPFAGVREFLESGVVERALATAKVNEGFVPDGPGWIDGPRLFGAFIPLMVARGDTFAVIGEGDVGGAALKLELTLQRVPQHAAAPHLGRRLVVTRARWIDAQGP